MTSTREPSKPVSLADMEGIAFDVEDVEDIQDIPKVEKPKPAVRPGNIAKQLTDLYGTIGFTVGMIDPHCGTAIMENASNMAEAMERLAKENPQVKRVIERILSVNAIGQVITAHVPVIMAISMHHVPALRSRMEAMENGVPAE